MPYPTPLHDASGNVVGAVNMLVDLTERSHAEQARQLLASIVESRMTPSSVRTSMA